MNWQIEELQGRSILSFSDAHSAPKMGREATVFVTKDGISNDKFQISKIQFSYEDLRKVFMKKHPVWKIGYTIEFYPEEGKYHFSGHRNCKVVFGPEEIAKQGTVCPTCGKRLTEGVVTRLNQLADVSLFGREETKKNAAGVLWYSDRKKLFPPYVKLVPLLEVVAEALRSTVASQKSKNMFQKLIADCGSEIDILLNVPFDDIAGAAGQSVADGVRRVRRGDILIDPGYDGVYGKVEIWKKGEERAALGAPQLPLDF
jgi:PHP family Zn ribbon phosphoesterase